MYYAKPTLKNLSQGARLKYIRKHRHMSADDVAEYFGFGGKEPHKTFNSYEKTDYNEIVQCAFREWKLMREKRENFEISDDEYLEWKLNLEVVNPIKN